MINSCQGPSHNKLFTVPVANRRRRGYYPYKTGVTPTQTKTEFNLHFQKGVSRRPPRNIRPITFRDF